MDSAAQLIVNSPFFPQDRLPTIVERCESYVWQRDDDDNALMPCGTIYINRHRDDPQSFTHPGADLVFAATLILDEIRRNEES
jgi:hypothetical protein